jgi:hypothetical protein
MAKFFENHVGNLSLEEAPTIERNPQDHKRSEGAETYAIWIVGDFGDSCKASLYLKPFECPSYIKHADYYRNSQISVNAVCKYQYKVTITIPAGAENNDEGQLRSFTAGMS